MADKFIDIEKIIADKNPKLAKRLPKFIINYLKKTLHEDETNQFLEDTAGYDPYEFVDEVIRYLNINVEIEGLENIPKTGGYIMTANHPLGGMDAISIIQKIKPIRKDIKFVVNDILLNLKSLAGIFVGVNKHGTNSKDSLRKVDELFGTEQLIFVFPAGLVSRKKRGIVKDLEWKKTFVSRAKKYEKDVIPVFIEGSLGNFFYRLANFRKGIGVKANIEMLYLVDELYQQRDKTIRINIGEPIPHETFDKSKSDKEWANWVRNKVYELDKKK